MLCYRILIFGEWPAGLRGGNVYCRHQYWTLGICNISERMHLFSSMLDSETISLGSQSTANLTFHSGLYTTGIHSPFLSLVLKKSPERVLGLKYFVVYLSCTKCPPFADIRPLRNSPHPMVVFSVNESVMVVPCALCSVDLQPLVVLDGDGDCCNAHSLSSKDTLQPSGVTSSKSTMALISMATAASLTTTFSRHLSVNSGTSITLSALEGTMLYVSRPRWHTLPI